MRGQGEAKSAAEVIMHEEFMRKAWYDNVLMKYKKEILASFFGAGSFALFVLLWRYGLGHTFHWKSIEPLSQPEILSRSFYSALAFRTIGAGLFGMGFYFGLHAVCVRTLGDWRLYKNIKRLVWAAAMVLTYWALGKVVDLLNWALSVCYNLLSLILYLIPPFGATTIVIIGLWLLRRRSHLWNDEPNSIND